MQAQSLKRKQLPNRIRHPAGRQQLLLNPIPVQVEIVIRHLAEVIPVRAGATHHPAGRTRRPAEEDNQINGILRGSSPLNLQKLIRK